jgi:abhydrolase domain-containing protein 6
VRRRSGPRFGRRRRRSAWRWLLWLTLLGIVLVLLAGMLWPRGFLAAEFARQRWLAGAEQRSLVVDGQRWNYLEAGQGPPVLLLHGFTGSKENWLPVIAALAREYRVIAPDLPGWGFLDPDDPRPPYGYLADAARLAAFADSVIPQARYHLVGHSMGGGIAAVHAGQWPQRIERLVLMSAAGVAYDNAFTRSVLGGEHPFAVDDRASLDRFMRLVFDDPPWLPWPADRALIKRRIENDPFERAVLAAISTGADADAPGRSATDIRAPTLLLWCSGDQVVDAAAADVYAALIADAQVELLQGCNHMPMMERPRDTATAVLEFLRGQ